MSAEAAYRAALRWYPTAWRRANEDVVLGTLLDVAEGEGRDAPTRAELRDLRWSGLRTRADTILPATIRDRAAAVSLGAGTAFALATGTGQLWSAWDAQGIPAEPRPDGVVWQVLIYPGLWILAAVAAFVGWTVVSRVLLVATLPASAIAVVSTEVSYLLRPSTFTVVMVAVLALLACTGRSPRRWLLMSTACASVVISAWLTLLGPFARTYFPRGGLVDLIGSAWPAVAFLVSFTVLIAARRPLGAAAVVVAAIPWLMAITGRELWFDGVGGGVGYLVRPLLILAIVGWIPVAILLAVRRYARAPWLSPSESSDSRTSASRPSSTR